MKETLNNLSIGNLQVLQAESGYRFSLDPILLTRFLDVKKGFRVVDLGTGCGILPLLLARLEDVEECIGIELQPALADRAVRNVELNFLRDRVRIIHDDIRNIRALVPAGSIDLVVSNPPYRRSGTGKIAPNDERAAARHELAGGVADFIGAARWLLKNGGNFSVIYLAERLPELMTAMIAARARPLKLRKGVLEVQVDHPVWMQQLQMMKPQILEKINSKLPNAGITDIYLRQTRGAPTYRPAKNRQKPEPPPWTKIELTDAEKESIEEELSAVKNTEVKLELRKLFTLQKQLDKERRNN